MAIPKGAQVRQVVPAIVGEVIDRRFDDSTEDMQYLVSYTGADDAPAERWFAAAEIEVTQ